MSDAGRETIVRYRCRACGTEFVAAGPGVTPCPRCGAIEEHELDTWVSNSHESREDVRWTVEDGDGTSFVVVADQNRRRYSAVSIVRSTCSVRSASLASGHLRMAIVVER